LLFTDIYRREILGNIRAIKGGEIITITTESGKEYKYQAGFVKEVSPNETKYLEPSEKKS